MSNYKYVLYEKDEGVVVITLNRPERRNAFGLELRQDFDAALQAACDDYEIRAIVVTGAGPAWSAGADLTREPGGAASQFETLEGSVRYSQRSFLHYLWMRLFPKPIIAAVNGPCVGMAFEVLLNMDIIIASEKAIFGAPEVRHGSIEMTRLPFIIGSQMTKRLLLTGDRIDAKEAYRIGLVTEVVPADKLMETALRLAKRIAKVPRHAIMMNKLMIDGVIDDMGFMNAISRAALYTGMGHYLMTTPHTDAADLFRILAEKGPKAFIEARDSNFPPEEGLPGTV
jgi:enoyl-CoA hydratase